MTLLIITSATTFLLFFKSYGGLLPENEKVNLLLVLMFTNGTSLVFYIVHVIKNSSLTLQLKFFWAFGIWGLHMPFSLVYWLLHINRTQLSEKPGRLIPGSS